jgi:hypothetical protein
MMHMNVGRATTGTTSTVNGGDSQQKKEQSKNYGRFKLFSRRHNKDKDSNNNKKSLETSSSSASVSASISAMTITTEGAVIHEDETSASTLLDDISQHQQQQSTEQQQHQQQDDEDDDDDTDTDYTHAEELEYTTTTMPRSSKADKRLARFLMRQYHIFQELNEQQKPDSDTDNAPKSKSNLKTLERQSTSNTSMGSSTRSSASFHSHSRPGQHEYEHDLLSRIGDDSRWQPPKPQRVVCQCCYQDIAQPATRSITCSAQVAASDKHKHSFCADCVKRYVESWVFGGSGYTLRELPVDTTSARADVAAHVDGALPCLSGTCTEGAFTDAAIYCAVSPLVAQRYHEKLESVTAVTANSNTNLKFPPSLDDPWRYSSSMDEHDNSNDNSNNNSNSAKLEKESSASSKTALDLLEQGYHQAHEALTYAKMRQCPYCKVSFLKESDSCNKMTCPSCRKAMCYICRKPVELKGYEHFCQHAYDSCNQNDVNGNDPCNKCPLWTLQDDARDREHLRQVAVTHANRVWGESLLRADQHEIRLDVDKLLLDEAFITSNKKGELA